MGVVVRTSKRQCTPYIRSSPMHECESDLVSRHAVPERRLRRIYLIVVLTTSSFLLSLCHLQCRPTSSSSSTACGVSPAFVSSLTPGSPEHLAEAKSVLEETYHGTASTTHIHGPSSDPTIESTSARRGDDRLVVMIAGGMSSKLTYDGIDVCASRVAWEVGPRPESSDARWTASSPSSKHKASRWINSAW